MLNQIIAYNLKTKRKLIQYIGYQPDLMRNEIPLICYLKLHETNKNQLTNFTQIPKKTETLQMIMSLYLRGKSFVRSNKPLMVFTGTNESSVEYYLNAVTANLI